MTEGATGTEERTGTRTERFTLNGEDILAKLRELVHEGNVRRIIIRDRDDRVILEAPLTIGVVGVALIPMWAAVGAVVALATDCSIEVERRV